MKQTKSYSYAEAMEELEHILRELESGSGTLEQDLQNYEKGMQLCGICKQQLDDAQLKIENVARQNSRQVKGE